MSPNRTATRQTRPNEWVLLKKLISECSGEDAVPQFNQPKLSETEVLFLLSNDLLVHQVNRQQTLRLRIERGSVDLRAIDKDSLRQLRSLSIPVKAVGIENQTRIHAKLRKSQYKPKSSQGQEHAMPDPITPAQNEPYSAGQQDAAKSGTPEFTKDWFIQTGMRNLQILLPELKPVRALEIGCFEGQCSHYLAQSMSGNGSCELTCVDTWQGGFDNISVGEDMGEVERRFDHNIALARLAAGPTLEIAKMKGLSHLMLAQLLVDKGENYYDLVYVDGSHESPDVLLDASLGFKLLRSGGYMIFDDYLWSPVFTNIPGGCDPLRTPKLAIDFFVNVFIRQLQIDMRFSGYQLYVRKR